jgi:cell division septation protein DedD
VLKKLIPFLFILLSLSGYGQDITASVKTVANAEPGKEFIVEITVNKSGVTGFIKYFQEIPASYSASDVDSKGGAFTFADNGAKIIWISPPVDDQFVMTYKILVPPGASGTISVGGKFSYLTGNERKTFELAPQTVTIGISAPAKEKAPPAETKPAETKNPTEEKPKPAEVKKENPAIVPPTNKAPATAAAISSAGRSFRVQIGAFSQKPDITGVPEPSKIVLENGVTKYFSGNFKTYDEAKKRKSEMIEKGFQGAFIVAFENGVIVK